MCVPFGSVRFSSVGTGKTESSVVQTSISKRARSKIRGRRHRIWTAGMHHCRQTHAAAKRAAVVESGPSNAHSVKLVGGGSK
jgi:hypothetical protein